MSVSCLLFLCFCCSWLCSVSVLNWHVLLLLVVSLLLLFLVSCICSSCLVSMSVLIFVCLLFFLAAPPIFGFQVDMARMERHLKGKGSVPACITCLQGTLHLVQWRPRSLPTPSSPLASQPKVHGGDRSQFWMQCLTTPNHPEKTPPQHEKVPPCRQRRSGFPMSGI